MTELADALSRPSVRDLIANHLDATNIARLRLARKNVRAAINEANTKGAFKDQLRQGIRRNGPENISWWKVQETLRNKVGAHVGKMAHANRVRLARNGNGDAVHAFLNGPGGLQRLSDALRTYDTYPKFSIPPRDIPAFKAFFKAIDTQPTTALAKYAAAGGSKEDFGDNAATFVRFVNAILGERCTSDVSRYMYALKEYPPLALATPEIVDCIRKVAPLFIEAQRAPGELATEAKKRQNKMVMDAWKGNAPRGPAGRLVKRLVPGTEYIMFSHATQRPSIVKYIEPHPQKLYLFTRAGLPGGFFASRVTEGTYTVVAAPDVKRGAFTLYHVAGFASP